MPVADPEFAFLLDAYRQRDPLLSETFDAAVRPLLRRMARKRLGRLPDDAVSDIVQEVFLGLLNPETAPFDVARGTMKRYLLGRVLNAVKTVQISWGLRRSGSDFDTEPQRQFVPLQEWETVSAGYLPLGQLHAREMADKVFAGLDPEMERACTRVWADHEPQADVALDLGISRFALARRLAAIKTASAKFAACA
jgi:DNA-directed RNA polymerase specialized sigma24 family protein